MFVLCVLYSKDERHSQDNRDKEVLQMKYREQKKKESCRGRGRFCSVLCSKDKGTNTEKVQRGKKRKTSENKNKKSGGGEFFRTRPDRSWGSPSLLYNWVPGLFPGGKAAGAWR